VRARLLNLGIRYDSSSLDVEPIRAQDKYSGVRIVFDARHGTIRERVGISIIYLLLFNRHTRQSLHDLAV
jgi:hypothetical protein